MLALDPNSKRYKVLEFLPSLRKIFQKGFFIIILVISFETRLVTLTTLTVNQRYIPFKIDLMAQILVLT